MAAPLLKPAALKAGGQVAVIAPASSAKPERIDLGIAALRALGYEVVEGRHLRGHAPQYFSATVEQRIADLHWAFTDPEIHAVFCSRGGYGSNYLLEHLDLSVFRGNPKPLFAYSDMTVLQNLLLDRAGLVSFHGPMVAADLFRIDGAHRESLDAALRGGMAVVGEVEGLRVLRPGAATGILYGGCLSMIVSMLGTPFAAKTEGKLLFLEDVGVKAYQVDRMLRHMILAGKLDGVKGIVFGEMLGNGSITTGENGPEMALMEAMILRVLDWFDGPIAIGLRSGHVSRGNVTLPLGVEAELALEGAPLLRFLETAVTD